MVVQLMCTLFLLCGISQQVGRCPQLAPAQANFAFNTHQCARKTGTSAIFSIFRVVPPKMAWRKREWL